MRVGVLALQGDVSEHARMLTELGSQTVLVKRRPQLEGLQGLVIPGGESTTIGKLMREYNLLLPIRAMAQAGMPVFGTCAGLIVLAKEIEGASEAHLGLMDIGVNRNSFGRQRESFETDLEIFEIGTDLFPAVFIRAPHVTWVGDGVRVLAHYQDRVVAVRENNLLGLSFHPELTGDARLHQYFLSMVKESVKVFEG
ncbi:pyridoxal 5'-phosphate synthase glutaminase subunit PdxT [Alicyclobacillaceae bacterium I2511]|nr:pyridoxal 5'-phosphate synthase glutaminase subunit PdxT [Alicyclobacillaceae bacterium I2511]